MAGDDSIGEDRDGNSAQTGSTAETVRDRQVARALSRLDARGELTPRRREEIERLADRLVEELAAVPAGSLVETGTERAETTRTLLELFDD